MKKLISASMVLFMMIMLVDKAFAIDPIPNIKANGSDGPITITTNDTLLITVELNPGTYRDNNSDWWIAADTPLGWYYYDVIGGSWSWISGFSVTCQGGLFDLTPFDVLNISGLRTGTFTFYFGVDMTMDGKLDIGSLYCDCVEVNIQSGNTSEAFYIYKNYRAVENNFIPSGWMGDISAISFNDNWTSNCYSGSSCINISFEARGNNWAGVYWQDPENNWGYNPNGGFDLTGCTKITFKARGENGGENIEFFAGGINGTYGDSFSKTSTAYISLTQDWQEFTIDLAGKDLSHVIGGFGWVTNSDNNPQGATFYLDEIKYGRP